MKLFGCNRGREGPARRRSFSPPRPLSVPLAFLVAWRGKNLRLYRLGGERYDRKVTFSELELLEFC